MFGSNWYWGTTRKYIVLFGTLFNDIVITQEDTAGNITSSIKVPLSYGPQDKMLARIAQDPSLTKEAAITLPRMSFEYHDYKYDGDRKLNTLGRNVRKSDDVNKFLYQYNAVPVNLTFSLYIYVLNAEDGTKIIEQIVPFFRPDWTAQVNLIPDLDLAFKIPIVLNSCSVADKYDDKFTVRRSLIWTLGFTLKGYLFGPIKKAPIIKFANTRFFVGEPSDNSAVAATSVVTPGLLANGEATSNASLSISPLLIDVDDDWAAAIQTSGLILVEE